MLDHNTIETSESEEMYLITIARLVEQGVPEPVSISRLAAELSIQPVSANQMVHKLAEEDLVEYLPYKGVRLTTHGRSAAQQVLRDRRLWEVFLVEYLELPPSEADALACRLEHITVEGVTGRLAKFLGYPSVSPQGYPIPDTALEAEQPLYGSLADLAVGEQAEIMRLSGELTVRKFLESEGLKPGAEVSLLARGQGEALLFAVGENQLQLTREVADNINIIKKKQEIVE